MVEHLVTIDSCRKPFRLQLLQFTLYSFTYLDNIRPRRSGDQNSHSSLPVVKQFIASGIFIIFFDAGYITQTQLVVIMSLNQHTSDILHRLKLVTDRHTDTIIAIIIISGISSFILPVQRSKHLRRFHPQIRHAVLQQRDIDTLRTLSIQIHPLHSVEFADLPFDKLRIIG